VAPKPEFLKALQVVDIFSVSACISEDFADYHIQYWKHNGYWLFDSPEIIRKLAPSVRFLSMGLRCSSTRLMSGIRWSVVELIHC
jgi:hypothetical protein